MGVFVSALVALSLLVAGCGGGGPQGDSPPVTGSFLREVPDEEAFVAIVAASPDEEVGQERDVRAYLCDGELASGLRAGLTLTN